MPSTVGTFEFGLCVNFPVSSSLSSLSPVDTGRGERLCCFGEDLKQQNHNDGIHKESMLMIRFKVSLLGTDGLFCMDIYWKLVLTFKGKFGSNLLIKVALRLHNKNCH